MRGRRSLRERVRSLEFQVRHLSGLLEHEDIDLADEYRTAASAVRIALLAGMPPGQATDYALRWARANTPAAPDTPAPSLDGKQLIVNVPVGGAADGAL